MGTTSTITGRKMVRGLRTTLRALPLLPLLLLGACGEDAADDPEREAGRDTNVGNGINPAPLRMTLDSTLDLPTAEPAIGSDTLLMRTPEGEPAPYAIRSARIRFNVVGDRVGTIDHIFRDYGRYERRVDSVMPTKENDPSPPLHELAITTPVFTGSYSYLSKQGWEMPIGKMYDDYLASPDATTLSLNEYEMKQSKAKRLADTTINGYETRVYRIEGGPMIITLWMWRGLPIRVHNFVPLDDLSFTYEPVSIELDVATPDELFTFPKGARIEKRETPPPPGVAAPPPGA